MNTKHLQLATSWVIYQGLKVTPKNLKNASLLSIEQLETMLKQRGIIIKLINP